MFPEKFFTLNLNFSFNSCLLFTQFLVDLNLALFNLLGLHVPYFFVAALGELIESLLMFEFNSLTHFFFHVLEHHFRVKLNFSLSIFSVNLDFTFVVVDFPVNRLSECLFANFVFLPIFLSHLLKFSLFLLQLETELISNLKDFSFFVFVQCAPVVLCVSSHLLTQLQDPFVYVFVDIMIDHFYICSELLAHVLCFKKLVIFYF